MSEEAFTRVGMEFKVDENAGRRCGSVGRGGERHVNSMIVQSQIPQTPPRGDCPESPLLSRAKVPGDKRQAF
eukprot:scaffold2308_cov103-Cylindrotheca_fusiformis.AAC.1